MKEYIVDLTNNLIGNHRFDQIYRFMKESKEDGWRTKFLRLVEQILRAVDVDEMHAGTLGKAICSFEAEDLPDLPPTKIRNGTESFLKDCVANLLAYSIQFRLDDELRRTYSRIPPYPEPKTSPTNNNVIPEQIGS